MNREILFRGFHKDESGKETIYLNGEEIKGKWLEGSLIKLTIGYQDKYYIVLEGTFYSEIELTSYCDVNAIWEEQDFFEVISETVGQYTGLTDKNGEKIFEGDIMKNKLGGIGIVKYDNYAEFILDFVDDNICTSFNPRVLRAYEVIGTIFDKEE